MNAISKFAIAAITGISIYLMTFIFIVHKPLTVGIRKDYFDYKINYLASIAGQPKIAIFAGSNGRYSHRCETIEHLTDVKCVNLSTMAGSNLKWEFDKYQAYFKSGDVLYLPFEYEMRSNPSAIGNEAPYIVAYDHSALFDVRDPNRAAHTLFYFDLKYLLSGLGEMMLSAMGKHTRATVATLTKQGDESGHDTASGAPYRKYIGSLPGMEVNVKSDQTETDWEDIRGILEWGKKSGIIIIGGLPTTPEDSIIPEDTINLLRNFYRAHGHCFLVLPNNNRYPKASFYDTNYHLNQETQMAHSARLAPHLAHALNSHRCPQ